MYIYYGKITGITKPFELPITRYDYAISTVSAVSKKIWIISLDTRQGNHKFSVCHIDRKN